VTRFDADMAAAICERLTSCCTTTDYQRYFLQFADKPWDLKTPPEPAACAATLATTLGKLHGKWASWAVRGSVKFDDARGAACVATMKAATCGEPLSTALFDEKCQGIRRNEVFTKHTPVGTSCEKGDSTYFGDCNPARRCSTPATRWSSSPRTG
jgi:hypothetical protein